MDRERGIARPTKFLETRFEVETCARCHARRGLLTEDVPARAAPLGHAPPGAPRRGALLRGRADAGRGLQLGLVPPEQDVRGGRHLLGLPRPARPEGQGRRRRRLLLLPPARAVRQPQAPLPPREREGRLLRRLPHADRDLHGCRPAARPLVPRAAAGPHGRARPGERPERLQRLPPRPLGEWAARAVRRWYPGGQQEKPHYATALHAGRTYRPAAEPLLLAVVRNPKQPGIVRGTAVSLLPPYLGPESLPALEKAATGPGPAGAPGRGHDPRGAAAEGARADRRPPPVGPGAGGAGGGGPRVRRRPGRASSPRRRGPPSTARSTTSSWRSAPTPSAPSPT